jgi:hypothetical protein
MPARRNPAAVLVIMGKWLLPPPASHDHDFGGQPRGEPAVVIMAMMLLPPPESHDHERRVRRAWG